jgi:hypothetical protein
MGDNLRKENKRLRAEVAELEVTLRKSEETNRDIMQTFSQTSNILNEKDRLAAEVEELHRFKDDAEPLLAEFPKMLADCEQATEKLSQLTAHTEKLRGNLESADLAFRKPGDSDLEEGHNPRQGANMALQAVLDFLRECGVRQKLCWPLINLGHALKDAEKGKRNPITAAVKFNKGKPTGAVESNQKVIASWAVTGLIRLGETKKNAYDGIVRQT